MNNKTEFMSTNENKTFFSYSSLFLVQRHITSIIINASHEADLMGISLPPAWQLSTWHDEHDSRLYIINSLSSFTHTKQGDCSI